MRRLIFILGLVFTIACVAEVSDPVIEIIRVYITATPNPTNTPTLTPSPTLTPTPTHTPTPTALPVSIYGNPRGYQRVDPEPSYGAPCGFVDSFDFPLDPPDGEDAFGRFGFGNYSNRYEKYHAGEDWGFRNAPNLGKSVYSIGHGQVTYAAPNGWGIDRGTVVIRHHFPWGGSVLSFYGHLDPPSVTIRAGDCIERGEIIGEIGKPRTPPHLHFEIRLHLPISAGHGYWSTNPANAGWLPPSQTIWETRLAASPGVLWTRGYKEGLTRGLGTYQDGFIAIQGGEMKAIDPLDGTVLWRQGVSETIRTALLEEASPLVYQLNLGGDLTAYPLPGPSEPVWVSETDALSSAELIPLPYGGVMVADRRRVIGVSSAGDIRWEFETFAPVTSWVHHDGALIFTTSDTEVPLWSANINGINAWDLRLGGKLAVSEEGVYLYAEGGLHRLDVGDQTAEQVTQLPRTNPRLLDLIARPGGGFLLIHTDPADHRLLALDPDGSLIWERSIAGLPRGEWRLISQGEDAYLLNNRTDTTGIQVDLYALDQDTAALTHILAGGSRRSYTRDVWVIPMQPDRLTVNIGGGAMVGFDPKFALDVISSP
jgi:murein DD-endopeptidase MepM/ murein hydrolase activator NlpD